MLLATGSCCGETQVTAKERLISELKEVHRYVAAVPDESKPTALDEPVLQLERMVVTKPALRIEDLLAQARRAAEAEKARKFSPLTGGLIYAKNFGGKELNLGIWPRLVPTNETPMKKGDVMLRVDLLRIKW